jgi:riboflavin kinase/FMN adenylyltransferase
MFADMRLIRRPGTAPGDLPGACVATIGTFDGVHVGHQGILERVLEQSRVRGIPSCVFSFEPTPREFFTTGTPPARLTRFREKYSLLDEAGIDWFFCPPFNSAMERLEPAEFIERLLIATLAVRHLVIGDDFVFARKRRGNVDSLRRAGERHGFTVEQVGSVVGDGLRVSSTEIRKALAAGELDRARRLLGRYYSMTGRVVDGQKLGKQLGFPTANVNLNRRASPVAGIFAVRVDGLGDRRLDGVASVGSRPTVDGIDVILEVHIFDFDRDIYGEYIKVEFIEKLRDEVRFPDLDSLTEQMHRDAAQARTILAAEH